MYCTLLRGTELLRNIIMNIWRFDFEFQLSDFLCQNIYILLKRWKELLIINKCCTCFFPHINGFFYKFKNQRPALSKERVTCTRDRLCGGSFKTFLNNNGTCNDKTKMAQLAIIGFGSYFECISSPKCPTDLAMFWRVWSLSVKEAATVHILQK